MLFTYYAIQNNFCIVANIIGNIHKRHVSDEEKQFSDIGNVPLSARMSIFDRNC